MYNPEIQAALGTQDEDKQNKKCIIQRYRQHWAHKTKTNKTKTNTKQKLKTMNKIFTKYGLFASK